MIAVQFYAGAKVAVLGLGRSGMATVRALIAGGAEVLLWDDSAEARALAEAEGHRCTDLRRGLDGVAVLITSPGIPHLYPAPHPVIAQVFVANPEKPADIIEILAVNKARLIMFLRGFQNEKGAFAPAVGCCWPCSHTRRRDELGATCTARPPLPPFRCCADDDQFVEEKAMLIDALTRLPDFNVEALATPK